MQDFGYMPKRDEVSTIGRYRVKILSADSRRMHLLEVNLVPELAEDDHHTLVQDEGC